VTSGFISVQDPDRGVLTGFVQGGEVFDVTPIAGADLRTMIADCRLNDANVLRDVHAALTAANRRPYGFDELLDEAPAPNRPHLRLPLEPAEIWGAGVSYRRAAELHEEDLRAEGRATGLYDYVFSSVRPEIFFKGVARHAVGHNGFFGLRGDSKGTIVEAELACVFDRGGGIVGYTIANDVTAWDIEKESPLFLCYAKIFTGSCGLGPLLVPAHTIPNPRALTVRCAIERGSRVIYDGLGNTANMKRTLEELSAYLQDCNHVPDATVLCTGTAVGIPNEMIIEEGDRVSIEIERLGRLTTVAKRIPVTHPQGEQR
jgi:2-dehydro-3-deoxy-D-arabinonate dehydratase